MLYRMLCNKALKLYSNHQTSHLSAVSFEKLSAEIFKTQHGAHTVCSNQQLLGQEQQHIWTVQSRVNYQDWVFHSIQAKLNNTLVSSSF